MNDDLQSYEKTNPRYPYYIVERLLNRQLFQKICHIQKHFILCPFCYVIRKFSSNKRDRRNFNYTKGMDSLSSPSLRDIQL